jgi:hypothetical protein
MRKHIISFVFLGLIFISSKKPEINPYIQNIWVGDYILTLYFDSTQSTYNGLPMIMDLSDPDLAVLKYFTGNEIKTSWSLNNGILTIDSVNYRIIALSNDSIVYSPYLKENSKSETKPNDEDELTLTPIRDEYYVFKRLKEFNPKGTVENITDYFNNKLFYNLNYDSILFKYGDYLDFLDNGVVVYKLQDKSSINIHLQEECWRIEKYKGYSFLFFYHSWSKNNGFMDHAHQIASLNDVGFTLVGFPRHKQTDYILANPEKDDTLHSKIAGKWISMNDTSRFYGEHLSKKLIKSGKYKLFDDTLNYNFYHDSLSISGNGFLPIQCNWRLNSDNSILIYEYLIETEEGKDYHVEYANIRNFKDDLLDLELFDNYISTGLDKPKIIILNRNQNFKRID